MSIGPLVTIGVANFNYSRYVGSALDSVANQTYQNIQLVIVDDFSSDDSVSVIKHWIKNNSKIGDVKFITNEKNLGISQVSRILLENAKGKYFQILDADDLLLPGKIEWQVQELELNKKAAFIYSNSAIINEFTEDVQPDYLTRLGCDPHSMPAGNIHETLFESNFISNSSVLISTKLARAVDGYDKTLQVQDYCLWLKLSEKFEVLYKDRVASMYRIHTSSLSNSVVSNATSIESEMTLLFRYYHSGGQQRKCRIKKNIHYSAPYLYQLKYPNYRYWLRKDLQLNPGIKTLAYFVASSVGVPFHFFSFLKQLFRPSK